MAEGLEQSDFETDVPRTSARLVERHRLSTRIWHWTNAIAFFCMAMSGLMIFNAHPRLYWGDYGANFDAPWLRITNAGGEGYLIIADWKIRTTGLLGVWTDGAGVTQYRAFPGWATIPSSYNLADARLWHLFFAWVLALSLLVYLVVSLKNRHIRKDLKPTKGDLSPSHIWQDIKDHARLRFPKGEAATRYNILQKLSYMAVLFVLLPTMILTGMAMSPALDARLWPLIDLIGGRQSARSLHFITMWLLLGFFAVHIAMVLLAGPVNEVRSMITGRFAVREEDGNE